jgi:hypothetical protein
MRNSREPVVPIPKCVIGENQITACLTGCVCYDNCFALPGCPVQHRRVVYIEQTWTNPGVCRIVKSAESGAPVAATHTLDSALEGVASGLSPSESSPATPPPAASIDRGCLDVARKGDTVVVHHGPCCHWALNALICPCWTTGPVNIIKENYLQVEGALGDPGGF